MALILIFLYILLSKAVYQRALGAVTLLLLHGADPNLVSSQGNQRAVARFFFFFFSCCRALIPNLFSSTLNPKP
jgi:hypothetical protein